MIHLIPDKKWKTLILFTGYLAVCIFLIDRSFTIENDNGLDALFPKGSVHVARHERFERDFVVDNELSCLLTSENPFDPKLLKSIDRISSNAADIKGVTGIRSILNGSDISFQNDRLSYHDFVDTLDYRFDPNFEKVIRKHSFLGNFLYDEKKTSLLLTFTLKKELERKPQQEYTVLTTIVDLIEQERQSSPDLFSYYFVGGTGFRYYLKMSQEKDRRWRIPLALLLIFLSLYVVFRSILINIYCLIVLSISASMTFGSMALFEVKTNIMTNYIFILILILGTSDLIHYLSFLFSERLNPMETSTDRVRFAQMKSLYPCFMTSFTTAAGFCGLLVTDAPVYTELGWFCAIGVIITFINSMIAFPWFLQLVPFGTAKRRILILVPAEKLARFLVGHYRMIGLLSVPLLVLFSIAMFDNHFNIDFLKKFRNNHPFNKGIEHLLNHYGYGDYLEVVVEGGKREFYDDPEQNRVIRELISEIGDLEGVRAVVSVFSFQDYLDPKISAETNRDSIATMLFNLFYHHGPLKYYVSRNRDGLLLRVLIAPVDLNRQSLLFSQIENIIVRHRQSIKADLSGIKRLWIEHVNHLRSNLIDSTLMTAILLSLILWGMLKFSIFGPFAILANIFPLAVVLSITGWTKYDLDMNIIIVGSVGMGIAVDDTIHFMNHLKNYLGKMPIEKAIEKSLGDVGTAMIITTLVLIIGFLVLLSSDFSIAIKLSQLFIITFIAALFADLILLPAWLIGIERFHRN